MKPRSNPDTAAFPRSPISIDTVTRDVKGPISAALLATDLVIDRDGHELSEESREDLDRVVRLLTRSEGLVRDLLRVLRVLWENEEWKEVDLGEVVERLVDGLGRKAGDSAAAIVVEPLPVVWGQARKLEQALSNLLDNAAAHVPRGSGVVRVEAKVQGTFVTLRVRDNGCGIPAKYLGRLFQLYSRVPRSGDRGRSGVGLAIVRRVAQEHGGRVWVESEVGVGSTFYLQLPNVVLDAAQEAATGRNATFLPDFPRPAVPSCALLRQRESGVPGEEGCPVPSRAFSRCSCSQHRPTPSAASSGRPTVCRA